MKIQPLILLTLTVVSGAAFAADGQSVAARASNSQKVQEQLQSASQKLVGDLDIIIDEYTRNGLGGEEIKTLKKLREIISKVSDDQMAKIVDLLKQAVTSSDPKAALQKLAAAYAGQKGVLGRLNEILASEKREQEAQALSDEAKGLAERQATNLQTGIETAQWALTGGKHDDAAVQASLDAQAAEQKAISDDLKRLQKKVEDFAKDPNNKAMADRFKKGVDDISKMTPQLDSAADLLNQKKLFEAVTNEKTARDQMRQLARTISPPREEADALKVAVEQLDKIIGQQKELIDATNKAKVPPIDQWVTMETGKKGKGSLAEVLKKNNLQDASPAQLAQAEPVKKHYEQFLRQAQTNLPGLESQQGDLWNQSDALSQDIAKIAKPAADSLQSAMPPMQQARGSLTDKKAEDAVKSESDAMAWLVKAKADLDQRLASAEKSDKPDDPVAQLSELQKQAQKLGADQAALQKATAAPKTPDQAAAIAQQQAGLQQKAQQLQQAAANADAPGAAQALDKAAANMQQAAQAAANPAPAAQAQAVQQQQQAMQNLAAAAQQLGQQAAQMQQAQQQVAADQKALEELGKIIEAQQKVQSATALVSPKQDKQPDAVRAIAPRQQGVQQDTNTFKKTLAATNVNPPAKPAAPAAAPAPAAANGDKLLTSASGHMGDAFGNLQKADGTKAQPDEKKALDDLYALQTALQAAEQAAQQAAGAAAADAKAAADAQAQANAAAAVAQAQQQAAQAAAGLAAAAPAAGAPAAGDPAAGAPAAGAPAAGAPAAGDPAAGAPAAGDPAAGAPAAGAPAAGAPAAGAPAAGAPAAGAPAAGAPAAGAPAAGAPAAGAPAAGAPAAGGDPAGQLAQAADTVGGAAADGGVPADAQQAMQAATQSLTDAAGQAANGQTAAAQASAAQAQADLAAAAASLAQAQAGISASGPPGAPGSSGPPGSGPPMPGSGPATAPGTPDSKDGTGDGMGVGDTGGAAKGTAGAAVVSRAKFMNLPERERKTILQAQSEKVPQEYSAKVEQYMRNLSDEGSKH